MWNDNIWSDDMWEQLYVELVICGSGILPR